MFAQKVERQLKNLGLNSYEVKIWTALLSRGVSTAGELSDIANVPRSRSYDVLESLEKKGFVVMKLGKPIKYAAVTPKEAIENTHRKLNADATGAIRKLMEFENTDVISELNRLHTCGMGCVEQTELSGSLKGKRNLYNHLECMLKRAEKRVIISTTPPELINLVGAFKPLFKNIKKKNVNIKILTQVSSQTKKFAEEMKPFAEIRHTDNKARFCIVDGKEIIFMVLDDNEVHPTYDVGIWVGAPLAKDLERFV